jgi:hypothetical protein
MESFTAILAAAAAAALITLLSAPGEPVTADPMPQAAAEQMHACANRPWPYLRCVGTPFGNPKIRLVTTDNLSSK